MSNTAGRTVMVQGRLVWTSGKTVFEGKPKVNKTTKQPVLDRNNQQAVEYGFGIAVPKSALTNDQDNIWFAQHAEAQLLYQGGQVPPKFAWKRKDGDIDVDEKGQPYSKREGYAGCMVFACTTTIPIKFFRHEAGHNIMINEGIKCGDYVQVQLNIKAHPPLNGGNPGLYMNPQAVLFLGYGTEIVSQAASGNDIFGTQAPALPPGASAMPIAPQGGAPLVSTGGFPPFNIQQQQAPAPQFQAPNVAPQMIQQHQAAAPQAPQPHYGILPQAHQPQAQVPNGFAPSPGAFQPASAPSMPASMGAPQAFVPASPYPSNPQQPPMGQMPAGFPPFPGAQ